METGGKRPISYVPAVALCVLVERDEDCNVAIRHRIVQQLLHDSPVHSLQNPVFLDFSYVCPEPVLAK